MARSAPPERTALEQARGRMPPWLRSGWTAVGLICLTVLALWLPDLNLPLGNSDDGRILGRFGLQARNFWELGPGPSRFGALLEPFVRAEFDVAPHAEPPRAAVTYAHHPPLQLFFSIASFGVLGDSPAALRVTGFVMGSATIAFMASLLRIRGLPWGPILLALAAMASTGFFYVYARIGVGFSLLIAATAMVAWLREAERPSVLVLAGAAAVSALTAMQSWIAMAAMGPLVLWLFAGGTRRRRRLVAGRRWLTAGWSPALIAVAAGAALGAALTAAWLANATDWSELADRVAFRTGNDVDTAAQTARFTWAEFLQRQWGFAGEELLAPVWLRVLLLPALIAGLADRRTRVPTAITLAAAAGLTFGFQQGAWIHRLWNFPWLAPATIGLGAAADFVRRRIPRSWRRPAGALAAAVAVATLLAVMTGSTRVRYLTDPADAGAVLEQARGTDEALAAERIWVTRHLPTPRWVSYYLDLPVWTLSTANSERATGPGPSNTPDALNGADPLDRTRLLDGSDLLMFRSDRIPDWFPDASEGEPLAEAGNYRLITAADMLP